MSKLAKNVSSAVYWGVAILGQNLINGWLNFPLPMPVAHPYTPKTTGQDEQRIKEIHKMDGDLLNLSDLLANVMPQVACIKYSKHVEGDDKSKGSRKYAIVIEKRLRSYFVGLHDYRFFK